MLEIERKFLVTSDIYKEEAFKKFKIAQGYLNRDPQRTVRIRIRDKNGFLTIKGEAKNDGMSRFEWEKEIPVTEAEELLKLCEPGIIEKTRFLVKSGKHTFEVDEFSGENQGLIVAEVELESVNEKYTKPAWIGIEVTGQKQYYNSELSKKPFKMWKY